MWRPGIAKQIVNTINAAPKETGIIPTAGVGFGGKQFLNFMSIKKWDGDIRSYKAWVKKQVAIANDAKK